MRIALITDGIWPYVLGGMQKHSFYLCKYLAKNQVQVDLIHYNSSHYDISKLEFFSQEERQFIRPFIVDFPKGGKLPGHYIRSSRLHSKRIYEAIKSELPAYDFIYTKGFTGWHLLKLKQAGKIKCAPVGVKFHGYEMFQQAPDLKTKLQHVLLLRRPVKQISLLADVVFSYGGKISDIIRRLGVPENKIFELPSGVEKDALAMNIVPADKLLRFVFMGRYERRKGIEELNAALALLKDANFEFHFIGPLPGEKKMQDQRFRYHGEIRDRKALLAILRSCDVLVCPSWSEGMPNVIMEAMANGLSVIATDTGASNVLVNERTGWLLEHNDPALLAAVMKRLLDMPPAQINAKKENALEHMRAHFVWDKLAQDFIARINSLILSK